MFSRYSWFIVKKHNEKIKNSEYWKFFLDKSNAQKFYVDVSAVRAIDKSSKKEIKHLPYNLTEYVPVRCKGIHCAVLIADRYREYLIFHPKLIIYLKKIKAAENNYY